MAEITISKNIFDKYNANGKVRLTAGYIQQVFEADGFPGQDGVVQITKGRGDTGQINGLSYVYRIRISDGVFQYNVLVSGELQEQVDRESEHLIEGAIIALTGLDIIPSEAKPVFMITGYVLLSRFHQLLSDPSCKMRSHNGNKSEHQGYRPQVILEDEWAEAENFTRDFAENNPPAAKMAKTDVGTPRQGRAAPPPAARKASSKTEGGVMPIAAVTPYAGNIKIHGTVSRKEDIKILAAKNMKIFNFELTDVHGDCIRITAFNEVAESIASLIVENMAYYVCGGTVRVANKKFNNTGHDYELTLRSDSKVEPGGDLISAPKISIKRIELSKIASHIGNLIDVMAVVERMDDNATEFTSRQGKELVKRELDLIDQSAIQARLTVWGEEARKISSDLVGKVVAFKGVTPREFNGAYSLSTGNATRMYSVPELPGVAELFEWYETERPNAEVKMISNLSSGSSEAPRTIAGITEMRFGTDSERGDYATLKGMITRINPSSVLYRGCANEGCQKKVVENDDEFRCEKCQTTSRAYKWLYMIQFEISDETGQVYVTAFGDAAAKIVGKPAQELGEIKDTDPDTYTAYFDKLQFKPKLWRVRCKMETYNEEVRQRLTVYSVDEINQDKYIAQLEQLINQLEELPSE